MYPAPLVTISLKEYEDLKEKANADLASDQALMAREIVAAMYEANGAVRVFNNIIQEKGIRVVIPSIIDKKLIESHITVERIKK